MNLVSKKRITNIVFDVIIIIICLINIIVNIDNYVDVLTNDYLIVNDIKELDDNKYVYANLKDANQEIYSLKNEKIKVDLYTIRMNSNDILVLLKENTIPTDKVALEVIEDESITSELKDKLKDKKYYKKVLSNININNNEKIDLYKAYFLFGIILISFVAIIVNIFLIKKQ